MAEVQKAGCRVTGILGGPKVVKVTPKEGAPFEKRMFWVNTGAEHSVKVVAWRDDEASMIAALTPRVGHSVTLDVEPAGFYEMRYVGVEV